MNLSGSCLYLLFYNNTDVDIMIKTLFSIINKNFEHNIDTQRNLSFSSNASTIKNMMGLKDFNLNTDIDGTTTEATFNPTPQWWTRKRKAYCSQDESFNHKIQKKMKNHDPSCGKYKSLEKQLRNLNQCVDVDDNKIVIAMYHSQDLCYLYSEAFTENN